MVGLMRSRMIKPTREVVFVSFGKQALRGINMKKIAVFGKPGSGKSTINKALAAAHRLPLHQLDSIASKPKWRVGRAKMLKTFTQNPAKLRNLDYRWAQANQLRSISV